MHLTHHFSSFTFHKLMKPNNILRPHISQMDPYSPILPFEVLSEQLGVPMESIVKLDANENPYGPLPQVAAALADIPHPHIYPDPENRHLRAALAAYHGLPAEKILVGAGADELIDLIMRLILDPGDVILNCPPTFGMYRFDAEVNDARVVPVPRDENFKLDLAGIANAMDKFAPKALFLASPNNPNGSLLPPETLTALLDLPLLIVLDEAYVDFAPPGSSYISSPLCRRGSRGKDKDTDESKIRNERLPENLVVLRTFSKWAGLAGLRLGYGIFPNWMMPHLWKIKQPYNVSVAASSAGMVSLEHVDQLEKRGQKIIAERKRLYAALQKIPWLAPYPSQANFILCRVLERDAKKLKDDLAVEGILIRYFNKPRLIDHVRISVGTPEQMKKLIDALERTEKNVS